MIITRAKAEEAASVFGFKLDGILAEDLIIAAYRTEAKKAHPDAGGSPEAFARVDWAKHALLAWIEQEGAQIEAPTLQKQKCHKCSGLGFTQAHVGFRKGARRVCTRCHGSGDLNFDPDKPAIERNA